MPCDVRMLGWGVLLPCQHRLARDMQNCSKD
jgi:hypothetical protein